MSGVGVKGSRPVQQGFAAVAAIILASFTPPVVAFPATVSGLWLGWRSTRIVRSDAGWDGSLVLVTAASLVFGLKWVGAAFEFPTSERVTGAAICLLVTTALGVAWRLRRSDDTQPMPKKRVWAGLMVLVALVMVAIPAISHRDPTWAVDVYLQHVAAAEVLSTGLNPYTDAVSTPNSSPSADDGEMIEGYPYPPLTLVAYSLGVWIGGDPAWTSVVTLGAAASIVMWGMSAGSSEVAFGIGMLLIGIPWLEYLLIGGWTEPLTLSLLAVAFALWRRRPHLSDIFLGLALASKQYLILLAPVLLMYREQGHLRRLVTAGGTVVLTMLPFAIWDPVSLWRSTVVRALGIGARPDTQSLPGFLAALGLHGEIPLVVWLPAVVVVGVFLGRAAQDVPALVMACGVTLGLAFATSLAFPNYWFLVAQMVGLATALRMCESGSQGVPHAKIAEPGKSWGPD